MQRKLNTSTDCLTQTKKNEINIEFEILFSERSNLKSQPKKKKKPTRHEGNIYIKTQFLGCCPVKFLTVWLN